MPSDSDHRCSRPAEERSSPSANVKVLMPTTGSVCVQTVFSLLEMRERSHFEFISMRSAMISKSRRMMAEEALKQEATHLLFIDSDMTFPPSMIERFLELDQDVVAANCVFRKDPIAWTAYERIGRKNIMVKSSEREGVQKVWRVGTGIMMIKASVFEKIAKPWFMIGWNAESNQELGEDYWFCQQLEAAGIPIWIDHEVSKKVGHVGVKVYGGDTHCGNIISTAR